MKIERKIFKNIQNLHLLNQRQQKNVERTIFLPFPQRAIQPSKKSEETDKEILETFRKVEVNILLLDAIKQIPRYAKFLKDLCIHRRRLKGNERPIGVIIQLVNRSTTHPVGLVEDVLVRVNDLIFLTDFYILDKESVKSIASIILGRQFLKTARTKIDVHVGTITMDFGDNIVEYDVLSTTSTVESNPRDMNVAKIITNEGAKSLPSMKQLPTLQLKPLHEHMKYAYLETNEKLPVIISNKLDIDSEERLLEAIKKHKRAIC
ncbi:uncharacterized protein LOC113866545 [Abrus precatorius]|uniref:Uncharacterized protein LOC113866545 n=1 Tax=Abrus precatorius TaxID=3816 RepID=A0A8B8LP37_ABRPR|nr:uncharacterized protein LOC113866545 [Abrus precatorius]